MGETTTVTREQVLAAIGRERQAWDDLIAAVGEARMLEPGAMGDWCFKDLAAHIAAWDVYTLDRLEAEAAGQPEPAAAWPDDVTEDDDVNAWLKSANDDKSLPETLAWPRETFDRLDRLVNSVSDAEINDPGRFAELDGKALGAAIVSGDYFSHLHVDHEPDIQRMLARSS